MATITKYIECLLEKKNLSLKQAEEVLDVIFNGEVSEVQIAAFLTAMRIKGVTSEELAGLAKSLRKHAVTVKVNIANLVDTCGTGGASIKTFNISTAAAFVAAGAGAYIAKHGNRGITSSCGSADVLAKLGVKIDASAEKIAKCIEQAHVGFMFAPMCHPAMKYVQPVRKGLGFRTVFNILGPLANPANVSAQVMGVADESLMETVIKALELLGVKRAMVVHSDGLDEISIAGTTKILELKDGKIKAKELDPVKLGFKLTDMDLLKAVDAETSAKLIKDIIISKEKGPAKDIVVLNAAAAIIAGQLADNFESAIEIANNSIRDGKAKECLEKLIAISNES